MESIRNLFRDREFNRKLLRLSVPIAFQNLMLALVAAADALMLGKVNQNAMSAVSLATQIQFVQNMIIWAIVGGLGILGAQYWGKNDKVVLGKIFGISIRQSLVVSAAFFIGCFSFPRMLMRLFAHDATLLDLGAQYLRVASWSYLFTGVSQCYLAIMKVSDHPSRSAWISSGAVILNILLNAVFIFGLLGMPAMGVKGAALATVCARVIELGWCVGSSLQKNFVRLKLTTIFAFNRTLVADFWHYSLPIFGAGMLWGIGFTSYTAVMGHLGQDAAAANSVAAVVRDLMCCLCNGFGGAAAILIGNELGAGRLDLGRKYGDRLLIIGFLVGFVCTIVILAVIPLVTYFLKLTPQAQSYMVGMFIILSIYMIGRSFCTIVINGVFWAGGDTFFDVYSLVVCMWGIALPCAFLGAFYFHWPVLLVYACTCLDEVGKIPWVVAHFFRYKWVRNITR